MTIVSILFFISLVGICLMLYRRVSLIRAGHIEADHKTPILPDIKEVRYIIFKSAKRYSFVLIEIILRTSIKSSLAIKKKSTELFTTIKDKLKKHLPERDPLQKKEVSGFLKAMSEYKQKIKKLKNRIIEEETKS